MQLGMGSVQYGIGIRVLESGVSRRATSRWLALGRSIFLSFTLVHGNVGE